MEIYMNFKNIFSFFFSKKPAKTIVCIGDSQTRFCQKFDEK